MIYVDQRKGSIELLPHLQRFAQSIDVEKSHLEFGDVAFEGKGPDGTLAIGVERKTLHDMLNCIDDARYAGHQRPGMKQLYDLSILMVEGMFKPHDPDGFLMEGFNGGMSWGYCKYRSQRVMYAKLYRYLMSVQLSGVFVTYSRDIIQTAFNVCEWYHYFQKAWDQHISMREMHRIAMPSLIARPPLARRWAKELDGIGVKLAEQASRVFKTGLELAEADEREWLRVPGVGVKTAQQIYREVRGLKR